MNGPPVSPEFGPWPMEAVDEFLRWSTDFSVDRDREKLLLTSNPCGYVRRR